MTLQDIKETKHGRENSTPFTNRVGGGNDIRYIFLYKCVWRLTDGCQAITIIDPHLEPEASVN